MTESIQIAIASQDDRGLDSEVSAHFGRCPFYVLVAVRDGALEKIRVVRNPYFGVHQPGVMPSFLQEQGADVVLTGAMDSQAIVMFNGRGIEVATGAIGTVGSALDAYLRGELSQPSAGVDTDGQLRRRERGPSPRTDRAPST